MEGGPGKRSEAAAAPNLRRRQQRRVECQGGSKGRLGVIRSALSIPAHSG